MQSLELLWLADVFGWLYFISWAISFYPQILLNYKRKSVVGLNFDFLAYNVTGFVAYSIFNTALYFNHMLQQEFYKSNKGKFNPVQLNDLFFSINALVMLFIVTIQCFIYNRGNQRLSRGCTGALIGVYSLMSILIISKWMSFNNISWLTILILLSYLKLLSTLIKYLPQVIMNWNRQSTSGWSIVSVLFDLAGGIFSTLQIFMLAYAYDDWPSIFSNTTKLGLGVVTTGFDIIFIWQHFVLYKSIDQSFIDKV